MALNILCEACSGRDDGIGELLHELAHMDERTLEALRRMSQYRDGSFFDQVRARADRRADEARRGVGENRRKLADLNELFSRRLLDEIMGGSDGGSLVEDYLSDRDRAGLEEKVAAENVTYRSIEEEDIRDAIKDCRDMGLVEEGGGEIRITPKGSRRLARHILRKILEEVDISAPGNNPTIRDGFGVTEGYSTRRYEFGDEFCRIDVEETLLAAFGRARGREGRIRFDYEDLWVKETTYESRFINGLIIDESGSMKGGKFHSAIDISLALSELVGRNGKDKLRVFFFSDEVREVPRWSIANTCFRTGITDLGGALRHFRRMMKHERGSKQAYLVTDSEPNTENGKFVGFEEAARGVIKEAKRFRAEEITLNVVMVEETTYLKQLASVLARQNLGRVFFTNPDNLARTIVKDYMKRGRARRRTGAG